jgi:hypothetical protein
MNAALVVAPGDLAISSFLASKMKARNCLAGWPGTAHAGASLIVQRATTERVLGEEPPGILSMSGGDDVAVLVTGDGQQPKQVLGIGLGHPHVARIDRRCLTELIGTHDRSDHGQAAKGVAHGTDPAGSEQVRQVLDGDP